MKRLSSAVSGFICALILTGCDNGKAPEHFDEVANTGTYSLCLREDGSYALAGSIHHGGSYWRLKPFDRLYDWNHKAGEYSNILTCAFSSDGGYAATTDNRTIALWNTETGEAFWLWNAPGDIQDLALTPEGNHALLAMEDYTATLFDIKNGGILRTFRHEGIVYDVSINKNATIAASASDDLSAAVWNIRNGEQIRQFPHANQVRTAELSDDGKLLLTSAVREPGRIWNTETGKLISQLTLPSGFFSAARFNTKGDRILTGTSAGKIQLWETRSGKLLNTWHATPRNEWVSNSTQIESVAFSKSSGFVAGAANGRIYFLK